MRKFLEEGCMTPMTYIRKDELMCPHTTQWVSFWQYVIFEEDWPRIKENLLENMRRGAEKHASKTTTAVSP